MTDYTDHNERNDGLLRPDPSSVFFTDDAPETSPVAPAAARPEEPMLPLSAHRSRMTRLGVAYSVLALLFLLAGTLLSALINGLDLDPADMWWTDWVLSIVPLYAVGLPVLLLLLKPVKTSPHNPIGQLRGAAAEKQPITFGRWMLLFVICVGCMYIGSLISTGLMNAVSALTGQDFADRLQSMTKDAPLWLVALSTAVAAPIGEEFIFRKLLIDRTRQYGDAAAILLSASFFALFHTNVFQLIYAFLIGAVLAYVYTRTGKYWLCVSLHAGCNIIGGVWPRFLMEQMGPDTELTVEALEKLLVEKPLVYLAYLLQSLTIYAAIAAAVTLLIVFRKRLCLSRGTQGLSKSETARVIVLNAGCILFALICAALTVLALVRT